MNLLFTMEHEWLTVDGDVATVGITNHAQSQLGDVVFVELPQVGRQVAKGDAVGVVESVKAASDVFSPLTGEVVGVNSEIVADPACGTGGFLLSAHEYLKNHNELDRDQKRHLRYEALRGTELVPNVARLCGMNLFLHGIGSDEDGKSPIRVADSLRGHPGENFDMVLTNPPFGRRSSITFVNEEGREEREASVVVRDDFWASTSNKQLNFVQHIKTLLKIHGRAAVVGSRADVAAVLEQQARHFEVIGGPEERRRAGGVSSVRIGAVFEQHFGHFIFAVSRALVQRHSPGVSGLLLAAHTHARVGVESEIQQPS